MSDQVMLTRNNVRLGLRVKRSAYYSGQYSREDKGTIIGYRLSNEVIGLGGSMPRYYCFVEWDYGSIFSYKLNEGRGELQLSECSHDWIKVDHHDFPCTMCKICNEVMETP